MNENKMCKEPIDSYLNCKTRKIKFKFVKETEMEKSRKLSPGECNQLLVDRRVFTFWYSKFKSFIDHQIISDPIHRSGAVTNKIRPHNPLRRI